MDPLRVFIVDDDPDFAASLALVIEGNGCDVQIAHSGEEAIQKHSHEDFDITFMDMKLPGKSGVQSLEAIRTSNPDAKVVMMTGYSQGPLLEAAQALGAWAILQKPFNLYHVIALLEEIELDLSAALHAH